MKLHLNTAQDIHIIKAYDGTSVRIDDDYYHRSLIVSPTQIITDWGPASPRELTRDHWSPCLDWDLEVFILGTGQMLLFPAAEIVQPLVDRQIGLEVMDTAAACRTYNILVADGRKVAAALIIENDDD